MAISTRIPPAVDGPGDGAARRRGIALGILVASIALAASMVLLVSRDDRSTGGHPAEHIVDDLISDMGQGRWEAAHGRFDPSCTDFAPDAFRTVFEPVLEGYRGHRTFPVDGAPVDPEEILLIRGVVDLSGGDHPFRAELVAEQEPARPSWVLCGFRIDAR